MVLLLEEYRGSRDEKALLRFLRWLREREAAGAER